MIRLLPMLLLAPLLWGLPDAPSTSQPPAQAAAKCGPRWLGGCWDYDHKNLTVGQTFKSPWFLGPTLTWVAADIVDSEMTHAYVGHPCVEGNSDLPRIPTRGQLYAEWAKTELPLMALGWGMVKLNRRTHWIYMGMATYATTIHLHAALQWPGCGR